MTSGASRETMSGRIAGTYPLAETYHWEQLTEEMISVTNRVAEVVPEEIGIPLKGVSETAVIGRPEWIDRNAAAFAHMTEPARRKIAERMEESGADGAAAMAGRVVDVQTRAVLSLLARRVLGQYELVLPSGDAGDVVSYVGPNILQIERTHQFRPAEFRYWVALHEMTHRAQFVGIPWMREYFMGLVEELVEASEPGGGSLARAVEELVERRSSGRPLIDDRGLMGLLGSPEQNEMVDKVQALMCVLEGHGHVVMDRIGEKVLKSQARMSRVLKGRRSDRRTAAIFRLLGLEMKMNQYKLGEKFVKGVERAAGWDAVNLAFRGAGSLPTLAEISDPERWLERVA